MISEDSTTGNTLDYARTTREGVICPAMRSGEYLVVGTDTLLPPVCVLCNAPAVDPPVIVRILAREESFRLTFPRKAQVPLRKRSFLTLSEPKVLVHTSYCPRHLRIRRGAFRWAIGFAMGAIVMAVAAIVAKSYESNHGIQVAGVSSLTLLLATAIVSYVAMRGPRLHHLAGDYFYLRGISRELLLTLPAIPSA